MLISDYSDQDFSRDSSPKNIPLPELLTAGMIFILPIIFLLVLSAQ